jgi:hypothetical protein
MQLNGEMFNFFNINKELDYTMTSDNYIDRRVLKVCKDAEENYIENQNKIIEIQTMKNKIKFIQIESHRKKREGRSIDSLNGSNIVNYEYGYNATTNDVNVNGNETDDSLQIKESYIINSTHDNTFSDKYFKNYHKIANESLNNMNNGSTKFSQEIQNNNKFNINVSQANEDNNNHFYQLSSRLNLTHKHLKSGRKCIACDLKKK